MHRLSLCAAATALVACSNAAATSLGPGSAAISPAISGPRYNAAGELEPPTDYRKWQFLTSGFAMTYGPAASGDMPQHDNVYVRPEVYDHFVATGTWPEQTMFVLEVRAGESEGSINHGGSFQSELTGIDVELKDRQRFAGGWGFYAFAVNEQGPVRAAQPLPQSAACYACHAKHAAVENTFTQFYPTLFPVAKAKGTVRADFTGMPPTLREIEQLIASSGWPTVERRLTEVGQKWPQASVLRETALSQLGYKLLQAGKPGAAVAALELVTRKYPTSANAFDSLAEAYEKAGNPGAAQKAIDNARRRLAADQTLTPELRAAIQKSLDERAVRLASPAARSPH
jgi:hypothetical protein